MMGKSLTEGLGTPIRIGPAARLLLGPPDSAAKINKAASAILGMSALQRLSLQPRSDVGISRPEYLNLLGSLDISRKPILSFLAVDGQSRKVADTAPFDLGDDEMMAGVRKSGTGRAAKLLDVRSDTGLLYARAAGDGGQVRLAGGCRLQAAAALVGFVIEHDVHDVF